MAVTPEMIQAVFEDHLAKAEEFLSIADDNIKSGFEAFADPSIFQYEPYQWELAHPPIIGAVGREWTPSKPGLRSMPTAPGLTAFPAIMNATYVKPTDNLASAPTYSTPTKPGGAPSNTSGAAPHIYDPRFPNSPTLISLPTTTLPYPYITIPPAPSIDMPVFDGTIPDPIRQITFKEYMDQLTEAYAKYSQDIPNLVRANWMTWFSAYLGERPLIDKLANAISIYMDVGGAGVPVPIEEAIITRNTDRVAAEQRKATLSVYDAATKRGLLLPSGAMLAGLKEARQVAAEAVSKVMTDVAIKNLELEHDHMKFMLQLGSELEKWVAGFATDTAKVVLECNSQAIEMTKFVLTGMVEINNIMVKIYLAQWEAYKAAVEVYKAKISAIEMEVRIYEAMIKAETAKVEVNKAHVEMINAVANCNKAIADVYKTTIDAETAKVESSRVAIMAYEAQIRGYVASVEAWKAQWQGYTAEVEGETAKAKVYTAQVEAYSARVNAYKAEVEGYGAQVHAQAEQIRAIGSQNETNLRAWSLQAEQTVKQYVAETEAYRAEWGAVGEQLKGAAENTRIIAESLFKGYEVEMRVDTERAHEHLAEWRSALEAHIAASRGMVEAASVAGHMASSALNGITSFVGAMTQSQS